MIGEKHKDIGFIDFYEHCIHQSKLDALHKSFTVSPCQQRVRT